MTNVKNVLMLNAKYVIRIILTNVFHAWMPIEKENYATVNQFFKKLMEIV